MQKHMLEPKLYILVRDDLSKSQKTVQAAHAACQYLLDHGNCFYKGERIHWSNGTIVCLKVKDEQMLIDKENEIVKLGLNPYSIFIEPDLNNSKTALAIISKNPLFSDLFLV